MRYTVMAFGVSLLLGVLASYHGFNLDVEEPIVFQEDGAGFGHSVAQFGRSRLVVGAPLEAVAVNQTGRLYDCAAATGLCQPILLHTPPEAVNMSLGLSLATTTNHSWLLACGPTLHRACGKNMFAEGSCLLLGTHLQAIQTVPAALAVNSTKAGMAFFSKAMILDQIFLETDFEAHLGMFLGTMPLEHEERRPV